MEDVLELYAEPYDPEQPVVCFDEKSVQLLADVKEGLPLSPGQPIRQDYEYQRCGTANLFVALEPHLGERMVSVTERRANSDFAAQMQALDARYPQAKKIRVVLDNLSTHSPAALYQSLPVEEARHLTRRLEFHYTPKHASWLNMAEIEWSVLERQCLGQRLESLERLTDEVRAWEGERNAKQIKIVWQFGLLQAREKLRRHYPKLETHSP